MAYQEGKRTAKHHSQLLFTSHFSPLDVSDNDENYNNSSFYHMVQSTQISLININIDKRREFKIAKKIEEVIKMAAINSFSYCVIIILVSKTVKLVCFLRRKNTVKERVSQGQI